MPGFKFLVKRIAVFPSDDALVKMIYLAYRDIVRKWTMPIRDWAFIFSHFSIIFKKFAAAD